MNLALLKTLKDLIGDPSCVVDLYPQLYSGMFIVVVQKGSGDSINTMHFLTYPCKDKTRELPIFTNSEFVIKNLPNDVALVNTSGEMLWRRLLEVMESEEFVAVDPGQKHGIRLSRTMILGMVSKYGQANTI